MTIKQRDALMKLKESDIAKLDEQKLIATLDVRNLEKMRAKLDSYHLMMHLMNMD